MATLAGTLGVEPLERSEESELLKLTREVAHRVERRAVPPASFLLGMDVANRMRDDGVSRSEAIAATFETLTAILPPKREDANDSD